MATVHHAPCVVLIPVLDDGRVVLIRQYRHSVKRVLWELPAGNIEPGETPKRRRCANARKKRRWRRAMSSGWRRMFPAPGYCDEEMIFFRVTGLHAPAADSTLKPDDDENITVHPTTVAEAGR